MANFLLPIRRVAILRLPQAYLSDGEAVLLGFQVDEFGEILCGGVFIDEEVRFVLLLKRR